MLALGDVRAQAFVTVPPGQENRFAAFLRQRLQRGLDHLRRRERLAHHLAQLEPAQAQPVAAGAVLRQEAIGGKRGEYAMHDGVVHAAFARQFAHAPTGLASGEMGEQRERAVQGLEHD
ncbi:hypothetical protein D3C72_1712000 [compost metagenome]